MYIGMTGGEGLEFVWYSLNGGHLSKFTRL